MRSGSCVRGGDALGEVVEADLALLAPARRRACARATSSSASPSACSRLRSRSTMNSRPGCRRPRRTTFAGSTGSTPASDPSTTRPSSVTSQRPGRRPLRSRQRAEHAPVGEDHRRRAVPGLDHRGAVAVEGVELRRHVVAVLVGGRDHHHHRLGERPPGERQQLEHAVEGGRVGAAVGDQRQAALEVGAEEVRVQRRLAGAHPVDVAGQRVDLAVVGEQPQRLGELPAREGVGREARVDDGERATAARDRAGRRRSAAAAGALSIPL